MVPLLRGGKYEKLEKAAALCGDWEAHRHSHGVMFAIALEGNRRDGLHSLATTSQKSLVLMILPQVNEEQDSALLKIRATRPRDEMTVDATETVETVGDMCMVMSRLRLFLDESGTELAARVCRAFLEDAVPFHSCDLIADKAHKRCKSCHLRQRRQGYRQAADKKRQVSMQQSSHLTCSSSSLTALAADVERALVEFPRVEDAQGVVNELGGRNLVNVDRRNRLARARARLVLDSHPGILDTIKGQLTRMLQAPNARRYVDGFQDAMLTLSLSLNSSSHLALRSAFLAPSSSTLQRHRKPFVVQLTHGARKSVARAA